MSDSPAAAISEAPPLAASVTFRGALPALVALAFLPSLVVHAKYLWYRPHYQFFPLVLVGAALLAVRAWRSGGPLPPASSPWGFRLAWLSLGLLAAAAVFYSPFVGAVAALVALAAAALALGGW